MPVDVIAAAASTSSAAASAPAPPLPELVDGNGRQMTTAAAEPVDGNGRQTVATTTASTAVRYELTL